MDRLQDDENTVVDEEIVCTVVKTRYTSGVNEAEHTPAVEESTLGFEIVFACVVILVVIVVLVLAAMALPRIVLALIVVGAGVAAPEVVKKMM